MPTSPFHDENSEAAPPAEAPNETAPAPAARLAPEEILRQLQRVPYDAEFAPYKNALACAPDHREAITPALIAAVDCVSANPDPYLRDAEDYAHLFALYLLAQFRETRALDAFIRFFSLPEEMALQLTADKAIEHAGVLLASVCGGNPEPLLRLAHDESVNEFVRAQAMSGLVVQAVWGERSREAVIEDLRRLFHTLPRPGSAFVWAEWVGTLCDFNARELLPEARRAFAEDLVDEHCIGLQELDLPAAEEQLQLFRERNTPVDAVAKCSTWACFCDDDDEGDDDWEDSDYGDDEDIPEELLDGDSEPPPFQSAPVPFVAPPKIGRNDPCPCGSGKKYKKCCGK
jgi:hypothetical protein